MKNPTDFIPFAKPSIGREEEDAVIRVLRSGWLTSGSVTLAFEAAFAEHIHSAYAIAVSSGTAGLHLALEAAGVGPEDVVITTPYTFAATAEVIRYLGAHPLFVDIDETTYNIDPELIKKTLAKSVKKISALIPVHIGGLPCAMDRIAPLALKYDLPIIEDCAHAFPVRLENRSLGTFGKLGVFSFYANKTITTGEGGMIVTDSPECASRIKVMRTHGMDREAWDRYTSCRNTWYYEIVEAGYKYNLTDIASAIGLEQLKKADDFRAKRAAVADLYYEGLASCDFLSLPVYHKAHAWHLFLVRLVPGRLTISRDAFIEELTRRGIGASVHYTPLHLMPYYKKKYGYKPDDFPVALKNSLASFSLPIYPDLSIENVQRIIETIKAIGAEHRLPHRKPPVPHPLLKESS